ncbi:hypothetical protein LMH87_006547 [Akanthomyces muscarius]|uniref:Uncharacterized protein n=1 Tax=Akanthomyces muscarius TaxID=2231603 RepID=A0A9W8QP05_AKAMU|nr:hypothetical protein LMH87_006547 [Akanthomyces muscarius]KAJ4164893.1 hypothetical protein LMH87_006547 [Akanthomyces muscarius]
MAGMRKHHSAGTRWGATSNMPLVRFITSFSSYTRIHPSNKSICTSTTDSILPTRRQRLAGTDSLAYIIFAVEPQTQRSLTAGEGLEVEATETGKTSTYFLAYMLVWLSYKTLCMALHNPFCF